jgi:hypothetical protein
MFMWQRNMRVTVLAVYIDQVRLEVKESGRYPIGFS